MEFNSLQDGHQVKQTRGKKRAFTAAPTTSAVKVADANTARICLTIVNNGSQTVYVGPSGVTTATGVPIAANGGVMVDTTCLDAWYAVTASGTGDLRCVEVS